MIASEQKRYDQLYQQHVRALKLRGYATSTIDVYYRAVRRLRNHFDCCPDGQDSPKVAETAIRTIAKLDLEFYFAELVESHTWAKMIR